VISIPQVENGSTHLRIPTTKCAHNIKWVHIQPASYVKNVHQQQ